MKSKNIQIVKEYLFYLFVFLLPWQTVWIIQEKFIQGKKWQWDTQGIYLFELVLILWLLISFYSQGWQKYKHFFQQAFSQNYGVKFFSLLLGWSFLSIFWSNNHSLTFYHSLIIFLSYLLYINLLFLAPTLSFTKTIAFFITSLTLSSFMAGQQFFTQTSWSNKWLGISSHSLNFGGTAKLALSNSGKWLRAYGSFPHPNILGGFLAVSLILLIAIYFKQKSFKKQLFILFLIGWQFFILLATFSRSAWLGFSFALLFLIIYFKNNYIKSNFKKITRLALSLILSFSLFFFFYSPLILNRFQNQSIQEKSAFTERLSYFYQSLTIIQKHFYLGIGLGNYTDYLHSHFSSSWALWQYQPVHNIYLLLFSELGLVGLILFLLFISVSFHLSLKNNRHQAHLPFLNSILIALLIISFFDHWLWTQVSGWFLLIIILAWINYFSLNNT